MVFTTSLQSPLSAWGHDMTCHATAGGACNVHGQARVCVFCRYCRLPAPADPGEQPGFFKNAVIILSFSFCPVRIVHDHLTLQQLQDAAVTMWRRWTWAPLLELLLAASGAAQFNNPPGVDIWCGKAYRAT